MGFGLNFGGSRGHSRGYADYWLPWQHQLGGDMGDYLLGMFGDDWMKKYAQPTEFEGTGMDMLRNWLSGTPGSWKDAQGAVKRAMTGEGYKDIIDPKRTEELYGAIENRTMKDILPKVLRGASNVANVGGMLRSGPGAQMQFDEMGKITNKLAETMSGLKYQDELQRRDIGRERERRQLQAVPWGMEVGQLPLRQIQAAMGYGGFPRQLMGMQIDNPLMRAIFQALGLRGKTTTAESGSKVGGSGGIGLSSEDLAYLFGG